MGSREILVCSFLLWIVVTVAAAAEDVKVTVESVTSIAKTDDTFVCATLDWWPSDKCDYNQCPWGKAGLLNLDLNNTILLNAIKAFNPMRLRIGGSLQDQVLYKVGFAVGNCTYFKKEKDGMFTFSKGCLNMDRWDAINKLVNQTGAMMTFGLNALFGRKKSKDDNALWLGDWNSQNSRDLMSYSISKGYKIDSYEFGNELCSSGVSARLDAEQYAKDFVALKKVVAELYSDKNYKPKILGPAGFYDEQWFSTFLEQTGPDVVDGLTHHIYNLGPGVDPNLINKVQDPFYLNQVAQTYKDVQTTINLFGPWAGAWVGESGGAYNSGGKDVSHTFADSFWYVDQLGMTSTFNHKVFCRQAFIGGNYGLLNTTTFIPNPDYYGALLWHRVMGKEVLRVSHSSSPYLRVYSHCSRKKPGISIVLINMSNSTTFDVSLINDVNLYLNENKPKQNSDSKAGKREEYHLTPKDGNIQSDVLLLNGTPLNVTESMDIPSMEPKLVDDAEPITVSPDSIVFATLHDFDAPACA